jgi:hypothetical protein
MSRIEVWINSVPRAELDWRARDARRRLERLERLLLPCAAAKPARPGGRLGWRLSLRGFGRSGYGRRGRRTRGLLGDRRPSALPETRQTGAPGWFCRL